jgi:hypothetical protein
MALEKRGGMLRLREDRLEKTVMRMRGGDRGISGRSTARRFDETRGRCKDAFATRRRRQGGQEWLPVIPGSSPPAGGTSAVPEASTRLGLLALGAGGLLTRRRQKRAA